jgi:hypothetical protein
MYIEGEKEPIHEFIAGMHNNVYFLRNIRSTKGHDTEASSMIYYGTRLEHLLGRVALDYQSHIKAYSIYFQLAPLITLYAF